MTRAPVGQFLTQAWQRIQASALVPTDSLTAIAAVGQNRKVKGNENSDVAWSLFVIGPQFFTFPIDREPNSGFRNRNLIEFPLVFKEPNLYLLASLLLFQFPTH